MKTHLLDKSREEIKSLCLSYGEPAFRGTQLCEWLFHHRIFNPEQMSNLSKGFREKLSQECSWTLPEIETRLDSEDGASKLLLRGEKNQLTEAVILRYDGRTSLCVSSQVGCRQACSFCQTGKLGFFRHLSTAEIMGQFCLAQQIVHAEGRKITHVVFMGMGEPLDNYENVLKAVNILVEDYGLSARRVTISTSGVADKILDLAKRTRAALAISLHACRDDLRSELMPINKRFPLAVLKDTLLAYQKASGEMITFEYILIKDVNCSQREAKELVRFLHGLRAKVNLIPFNHHPGMPYQRPSQQDIDSFQKHLSERGIVSPVRYSKGAEVSAACGQLAAKSRAGLDLQPMRKSVVSPALAET